MSNLAIRNICKEGNLGASQEADNCHPTTGRGRNKFNTSLGYLESPVSKKKHKAKQKPKNGNQMIISITAKKSLTAHDRIPEGTRGGRNAAWLKEATYDTWIASTANGERPSVFSKLGNETRAFSLYSYSMMRQHWVSARAIRQDKKKTDANVKKSQFIPFCRWYKTLKKFHQKSLRPDKHFLQTSHMQSSVEKLSNLSV